ncbi:questin oxidase family protein [Massilia violaceinigra]|uniref:Questin oxidase family protein n=1 Tax=Massilia violaceinigra TaxID=2045208 RepID=A0ABY4A677_9BURK|nr:questin oxidase family protein [Massilia violaceinigra]UOD30178.1 questin oxidase family protein [Massilia violaceinigra]
MEILSDTCRALLERSKRFGPLYGDRLANHLPMTLIALDRMGAPVDSMARAFDANARQLQARDADISPVADGADWLGKGRNAGGLERYFQACARRDGRDAVLRDWLPRLLPGVAASAFHCLIRLAYAIDAGDQDEACAALAYWVMEYVSLDLPPDTVDAAPAALAARLAMAVAGHAPWDGIIIDRMRQAARHPGVAGTAIQPRGLDLRQVAQFALGAYHAREDFTLLHTVTACHAFRLLLPYAGEPGRALRYLWEAVVVATLTVEPSAATPAAAPDLDWQACMAQAARATDAHVVKLCWSAYCEHLAYGDARYLAIAARKLASQSIKRTM